MIVAQCQKKKYNWSWNLQVVTCNTITPTIAAQTKRWFVSLFPPKYFHPWSNVWFVFDSFIYFHVFFKYIQPGKVSANKHVGSLLCCRASWQTSNSSGIKKIAVKPTFCPAAGGGVRKNVSHLLYVNSHGYLVRVQRSRCDISARFCSLPNFQPVFLSRRDVLSLFICLFRLYWGEKQTESKSGIKHDCV